MALSLALLTGGPQHILGLLAQDPSWQRTRLKSAEGAASVLVSISKRVFLEEAEAVILPDLKHWYNAFLTKNGAIPESPVARDNWVEAHSDQLLELFEPFVQTLSSDWLYTAAADAQLWENGEAERLAASFAKEVWKQLTWQRTDNQILAGVGIVADDLAKFGPVAADKPASPPPREYKPTMINAIINRIMLSFPDVSTLADDLDLASDNDAGLALGAAQRLGISQADTETMRQTREAGAKIEDWQKAIEAGEMLAEDKVYVDLAGNGNGKADKFDAGPELPTNLVRNASATPPPPPPPIGTLKGALVASLPPLGNPQSPTPPPPPPPPAVQTGAAPSTNSGRGGRRTKTPEAPPVGYIDKDIIRSIKEHAGFKDEDLAAILGLSRPTLANIMKGKGWYVPPDAARRQALASTLLKHIEELTKAHNAIQP